MNVPIFGEYADVRLLAEMAVEAEAAGWDGFWVWDHIQWSGEDPGEPRQRAVDPTVALTLIAAATQRVRLGPMLTPLARRRPWKVARELTTLDHLSAGRLTLGVGLGAPPGLEFGDFGEETDARVRAAKLDEGLDVLTGLWSGEPFDYAGEHYQLTQAELLPRPAAGPRADLGRWRVAAAPGPVPPSGPVRRGPPAAHLCPSDRPAGRDPRPARYIRGSVGKTGRSTSRTASRPRATGATQTARW